MSKVNQIEVRRIGIVDDDEDVRMSLGALVESLGHEGVAFESADAFIASGRASDLACIITDLQMPGTSGLQLARYVRDVGPPIILITAFPTPTVERQAREARVRYFLRKPFNPHELIEAIMEILA